MEASNSEIWITPSRRRGRKSGKSTNKLPSECMVCGKTFSRGIIDLQRHTTGACILFPKLVMSLFNLN